MLAILLAVSGWGFFRLAQANVGPNFVVFLMVGLLAFVPVPVLRYRAYSLLRAEYILDRDSLELRWGLRNEAIPLTDIEWVRSADDLSQPLTPPALPMPGAVLGLRRHPDLGLVE